MLGSKQVGVVVNPGDHIGGHGIWRGVGRPAASETMGQGSGASVLVGGHNAPGVARADAHEFSRLVQGSVLREEAVEHLKPGLFSGVKVTFSMA